MYSSQIKEQLNLLSKMFDLKILYILHGDQSKSSLDKAESEIIDRKSQIKIMLGIYPSKIKFNLKEFDFIYGRTALAGYLALKLQKKYNTTAKIITDLRGLICDELLLEKNVYNWIKSKIYAKMEKCAIKESDILLVVSSNFKKHILENYKSVDPNKISVLKPFIDLNKFYYEPELRQEYRKKLNLDEKDKLILYCGGAGKWQCIDEMLIIFSKLNKIDNHIKFLIITRDKREILERIDLLNISSKNITLLTLDNKEVNNYLNAADFGLLLRKKNLTNYVAYPTKFSEYLLAGLPVIMTKHIGCINDSNLENSIIVDIDNYNIKELIDKLYSDKFIRSWIHESYKTILLNYDFNNYFMKKINHIEKNKNSDNENTDN